MSKKAFRIPADQIKKLVPPMGGCIATDEITVEGKKVGYMYRQPPDSEADSGWRFFSGEESQEYVDDPANLQVYDVNTICNYDPDIIPYLQEEPGTFLGRVPGQRHFERE
jgi:hypothetical protein